MVWSSSHLDSDSTADVTAKFSSLSGKELSDTTTITFISFGMCGIGLNDSDLFNAAGGCLKVATDVHGNWFTSSPSMEVMNGLSYSLDRSESNTGDSYGESRSYGSIGYIAHFTQTGEGVNNPGEGSDVGVNGQFDRWCQKLASLNFGGKSNWRRPTGPELLAFSLQFDSASDGVKAIGWPEGFHYTSTYNKDNVYAGIHLSGGENSYIYNTSTGELAFLASCVSNP